MLNISRNSINKEFHQDKYRSLRHVNGLSSGVVLKKVLIGLFSFLFVLMFLPWTQNIRSNGKLTALRPDQRPQTVQAIIDGRIEKWFVQEGDHVQKGDTILHISEIKAEYLDPDLLKRTDKQLKAKESTADSYRDKVTALEKQIDALQRTAKLKISQAENKRTQAEFKVQSDSMDLIAAETNATIAEKQYQRLENLYNDGLKSLTDLENRKNKMQMASAKLISAQNKLLTSRNELLNAQIHLRTVSVEYEKDIAKAESDKFTALSALFDTEGAVNKLKNTYSNYIIRNGMYYILAPQSGYITKAIKTGLGENIKEGTPLLSIMPENYDLAVELYVEPIDLPLIEKGQDVRIQFDGWPAIVFSGWPNTSYGTYGGRVFAIDRFISDNGKFRVLVVPDPNDHAWPDALRIGGGTNNMMLLKDVAIWYELWRQINGFPPDYYKTEGLIQTAENSK